MKFATCAILAGLFLVAAASQVEVFEDVTEDEAAEEGVIQSREYQEDQPTERQERSVEIVRGWSSRCPRCNQGSLCCKVTYPTFSSNWYFPYTHYTCCTEKKKSASTVKDYEFTYGDFRHGSRMVHQHMRVNSKADTITFFNDDWSVAVVNYKTNVAGWYISSFRICLLIGNVSTAENADAYIKELQTATKEKRLSVANANYGIRKDAKPVKNRSILPIELEKNCRGRDLFWLERYDNTKDKPKSPNATSKNNPKSPSGASKDKPKPTIPPKKDKSDDEKVEKPVDSAKNDKKPTSKSDEGNKERDYLEERSDEEIENKQKCKMECVVITTKSNPKYRKSCLLWTCE